MSPIERGMSYEDVNIKSEDGIALHGWLIFHERDSTKHNTVIFMHENAGNIGLRMDYFELLYK